VYKRLQDNLPESRKLGRISDFAFRCWANGLAKADWFGRLTAEPDKFRITCFANRPKVSDDEIAGALDELADANAIHLYEIPEGRFLVFHRHEEHNPTGGLKTRPCRCPTPPPGLCRCVRYKLGETPKSVVGSTFRHFQRLFSTDQRPGSAPLCSSPLLSSEVGGSGGKEEEPSKPAELAAPEVEEGAVGKLCDQFTHLTGRPPLTSVGDPREMMERLKGMIAVRGLEPMVKVMTEKASECLQRTGRPPSSIQYFIPVFEDDRLFKGGNGSGTGKTKLNPGAKAVVSHFGLGDGTLGKKASERISRRGEEGAGKGSGRD